MLCPKCAIMQIAGTINETLIQGQNSFTIPGPDQQPIVYPNILNGHNAVYFAATPSAQLYNNRSGYMGQTVSRCFHTITRSPHAGYSTVAHTLIYVTALSSNAGYVRDMLGSLTYPMWCLGTCNGGQQGIMYTGLNFIRNQFTSTFVGGQFLYVRNRVKVCRGVDMNLPYCRMYSETFDGISNVNFYVDGNFGGSAAGVGPNKIAVGGDTQGASQGAL